MRERRQPLQTNIIEEEIVSQPIEQPNINARTTSDTTSPLIVKNTKYKSKSTLDGSLTLKEPKPKIKAKKGVTLQGLGSKLSGVYFVSKVKHNFKPSGYTQSLDLSREWKGESMKNGTTKTPTPKPTTTTAKPVTPTVTTRTYTIKKGDTLWAIAKKYYGKGSEYPKIFNANKDKIKNPNKIYPGQVIKIP